MAGIPPPPAGFVLQGTQSAAQAGGAAGVPPPPAGFTSQASAPAAPPKQRTAQAAPQEPDSGSLGAFWHGVQGLMTDRGVAADQAVGAYVGRALGLNKSDPNMSLGDMYHELLLRRQAQNTADQQQHPYANALGTVAGAGLTAAIPVAKAVQAPSLVAKVARGAATGAALGGVYGAGNAAPGQVPLGAEQGAVMGAGIGAVAEPVVALGARGVGAVARMARKASGQAPAASEQAANVLVSRAPQDVEAMTAEVQRQRALGQNPAVVDVLNTPGQRLVRAAAGKSGSTAGDTATDFAKARRANVEEEVGGAFAPVSSISQPVDDTIDQVVAQRKALGDHQFRQAGPQTLDIPPDVKDVLATNEGQNAVRKAMSYESDPAAKKALGAVGSYVRRGPSAPAEDGIYELIDGSKVDLRMYPPKVRDQWLEKFKDQLKPEQPPPPYTVDMADKISRAMNGKADVAGRAGDNTTAAALGNLAKVVRGHARNNSPLYAEALGNSADLAGLRTAAKVGAGVLNGSADEFTAATQGLSHEPVQVPVLDEQGGLTFHPEDHPQAGQPVMAAGPSQMDVAQAAARRTLEQKGETPGANIALATRLQGPKGTQRLSAIAPEAATQVQQASQNALDRLKTAQFINPRQGSQTAHLLDDSSGIVDAAHAAHGVASVLHGNVVGATRSLGHFVKRFGLSNGDAANLLSAVTNEDPEFVDQVIQHLEQRTGSKTRANQIYGVARRALVRFGVSPGTSQPAGAEAGDVQP